MASLWQIFPGVPDIDKLVNVYPLKGTFRAPLAGGKFRFLGSAPIEIHEIPQGKKGIIVGISFVSNIDQLTFSNAIDPAINDGFFKMNVIRGGNNHPINLAPFYFASFAQADNFTSNFEPTAITKGVEKILLSVDGGLIQTAEIAALGNTEITLQASINYYQLDNNVKR